MKIVSIANYKGGVGKTTITFNICHGLADRGYKVLMVDFDPQSNLTSCAYNAKLCSQIQKTIFDAMTKEEPLPIFKVKENLNIVPCNLNHSGTEAIITGKKDKATILKSLLDPIRCKYDYIFIDCPPTPGLLTINALVASDRVIVPIELQALPVKGIWQIVEMINTLKAKYNNELQLGGIAITRYKSNNLSKLTEGMIKQSFDCVLDSKVSESVQVAAAPLFQRSIFEHAPGSKAATQYAELVTEIENLK